MTTRYFNVKQGITTGNIILDAASGNVTGVNNANLGNLVTANFFSGAGNLLSNIQAGNITGQVANALVAGTVYTAAQPNITSVGTLTSLIVGNSTANVTITTGAGNGTLTATGNITAPYFIGNVQGNISGNIVVPGNNTAVLFNDSGNAGASDGMTFNKASNVFTVANNIISGNVYANSGTIGANLLTGTLTTAAQPNITSVGTLTDLTVTGNVTAGNVAGGNLVSANYFTGTLTTNAQPNITSVGTLTSLGVTGNVTAGNLVSNGSANISNGLTISAGGASITGLTSVSGNLDVTGNVNVTGNLNYENVTDLVVGDPLIFIGANNTGNLFDLGIVASYNDGSTQHTGFARDASDGIWKLFDDVAAEPTTVIDFANGIYAPFQSGAITSTGNISAVNANLGNLVVANYFSGDAGLLSNISGANITGTVPNASSASTAGTVTTNAQPNITSVGTLTSLAVTGNITAGNVSGGNLVSASYISGDGSLLTNLTAGNITGQVANALVAGTVYTNAQPNITSVGTLTSVDVTGNVTAGNIRSDHLLYANGDPYIFTTSAAGSNTQVQFNTDGNFAASANFTFNTGTNTLTVTNIVANGSGLTSLTGANVTGAVAYATTANAVAGSNVSGAVGLATYATTANAVAGANVSGQVGNALIAGTVYTNAQPNITSVGTLTSLAVSGDMDVENVSLNGGLTSNRTNVSVTTNTVIDQFAPSTYRTAKYIISASGDDGYQSVETLLVHDGSSSYITIYGSVCSNISADIIELSSNVNGVSGNVAVYATSASANTLVNVVVTYINT